MAGRGKVLCPLFLVDLQYWDICRFGYRVSSNILEGEIQVGGSTVK